MNDTPTQIDPGASKRKPIGVRLMRVFVGLVILWGLFHFIPAKGVYEALRDAGFPAVLGAIAMTALMNLATADRLKRLCDVHGHGWSTREVLQINLATRFYGLFLPGGNFTGIAIRFYKLSGDHKHYLGTAVALFYDRIAATVALCGLGAVFWMLERPGDSWQALIAILAAMGVMILALYLLFAKSPGPMVAGLRRTVSNLGGVKMHTVRQAVRESRVLTGKQAAMIYLLSAAAHLMGVVGWYFLCLALGLDISFITIGWVRSAMILATMIPVSVSGLGLREGAAVLLLTHYGVSQEDALAFSLLVFFVTTLLVGLAGGLVELKRYVAPSP